MNESIKKFEFDANHNGVQCVASLLPDDKGSAVEKYMDGVRTDVVQSFIDSRKEEESQKSKREKIEATVDKLHEKINKLEDKLDDMDE